MNSFAKNITLKYWRFTFGTGTVLCAIVVFQADSFIKAEIVSAWNFGYTRDGLIWRIKYEFDVTYVLTTVQEDDVYNWQYNDSDIFTHWTYNYLK